MAIPAAFAEAERAADPLPFPPAEEPVRVVVIPVQDQISKPILYILRRGLKEAIEREAHLVVLDMKTPGGALDVTFAIIEALDRFPGRTATFVNGEAISAGAFIAAKTDEIWFFPGGVIGAAAPVLATGQEIDPSMKLKLNSYLRARVRAASEGHRYRGEVISAMIDSDYELKIDDKVLKPKGELLSLTSSEAMTEYGEPPAPLLGTGLASSVEDLLKQQLGDKAFVIDRLEVTWSERLAQYLTAISPALMGLGLLALFVEFKTPGFGLFGVLGISFLLVVFFGHYVAGLSGYEPVVAFALGCALVLLELFFFPGVVFVALTGVILVLGSLLWGMADLWPNEPVEFSGEVFVGPLTNLGLGVTIAVVLALALARYLPRGWFWDRLVLSAVVEGTSQREETPGDGDALVGAVGVAATGLFPSGQVEIAGRRYEARLTMGFAEAGTPVVVKRRTEFGLVVEKAEP